MYARLRLLVAILLTGLLSGACGPLERDFFLGPSNDCFEGRELVANVQNLAFTFDSQGVGYFAVNKGSQVHVGSSRPNDFLAEVIGLMGDVREIAVDARGQRHLSLVYGSTSIYARENNGAWTQIELALDSYPLALKLDPGGSAHMLLRLKVGTNIRVAYATNRSGIWEFEELRYIAWGERVDMELDARGKAHIAYYDPYRLYANQRGIYYATNASGDWVYEQVNDLVSTLPLLALDSKGHPHLLYLSFGYGAAYHAKKQQGLWNNIYLEPPAFVEFDAVHDLKVGAAGALHALLVRPTGGTPSRALVYANVPSDGHVLSLTPVVGTENIPPPYFLGLNVVGSARISYLGITLNSSGSMMRNYVVLAEPCH